MRPLDTHATGVPFRNIPPPALRLQFRMPDAVSTGYDQSKEASLFVDIAALTASAPLDHYFSNLHRVLQKAFNAPIMVVGVKDFASAGGFKPKYRRDLSH